MDRIRASGSPPSPPLEKRVIHEPGKSVTESEQRCHIARTLSFVTRCLACSAEYIQVSIQPSQLASNNLCIKRRGVARMRTAPQGASLGVPSTRNKCPSMISSFAFHFTWVHKGMVIVCACYIGAALVCGNVTPIPQEPRQAVGLGVAYLPSYSPVLTRCGFDFAVNLESRGYLCCKPGTSLIFENSMAASFASIGDVRLLACSAVANGDPSHADSHLSSGRSMIESTQRATCVKHHCQFVGERVVITCEKSPRQREKKARWRRHAPTFAATT